MIINNVLLDKLCNKAHNSVRLRANYDLRTSNEDKSQRMLNALMPGTIVPIHRHTESVETVIILRGKLFSVFYDDMGAKIERYLLDPSTGIFGLQIPKGQWHAVEIIEPSVIFEAKDGPFVPLQPEDTMENDNSKITLIL